MTQVSAILPIYNESPECIARILTKLRNAAQTYSLEIIFVDDGSALPVMVPPDQDNIRLVRLPTNMGNGAAIKAGARAAKGELLLFMDADGQHAVEDIPKLLALIDQGYDMVVGARTAKSQASMGRHLANTIYNWLSSWMVGHRIPDLTSGFRLVNAKKFREFLYLLPNGFSYPTTITMAFFRAGYTVGYVPIDARARIGKSHIKAAKDSVRFFIIIFRVGTLYSPLKLFFPASVLFFVLAASYYGYTFVTESRFTNMSALLFTASVLIFLIGLVSEQITNLLYSRRSD